MIAERPRSLPGGWMAVSPGQLRIHMWTEIASAALGAPLLIWAGTRTRELYPAERAGLIFLGVGAIVVDTYLAARFLRARLQSGQDPSGAASSS